MIHDSWFMIKMMIRFQCLCCRFAMLQEYVLTTWTNWDNLSANSLHESHDHMLFFAEPFIQLDNNSESGKVLYHVESCNFIICIIVYLFYTIQYINNVSKISSTCFGMLLALVCNHQEAQRMNWLFRNDALPNWPTVRCPQSSRARNERRMPLEQNHRLARAHAQMEHMLTWWW